MPLGCSGTDTQLGADFNVGITFDRKQPKNFPRGPGQLVYQADKVFEIEVFQGCCGRGCIPIFHV